MRIVPNVPKPISREWQSRSKKAGEVKLVFLSLIAEMKNLHLILEVLKMMDTPVLFDIVGPIKDIAYWERCQPLLKSSIHRINYRGAVSPVEVPSVLQQYHAFILPTRGENFGHAIYEAMSVGTLPIISSFTLWGQLQDHHAGITVNNWEHRAWAKAIKSVIDTHQQEYDEWSRDTYDYAKSYFEKNDFKSGFRDLFE
jgi:glycosyltransferase involved in cell wall biosynthesis